MKLIDKSAVVAEIERRKKAIIDDNGNLGFKDCQKAFNEIDELKKFINTMEVKEVDFEKEWKEFLKDGDVGFKEIAKHFFELGLFSQLTWQDIRLISEIGEDFMNSEESDDLWKDEEVYYTAILNKLKEKGRNYKTERQIARELAQKGEEV